MVGRKSDKIPKKEQKNREKKPVLEPKLKNIVIQTTGLVEDEGVLTDMTKEVEAICQQLNNPSCNVEEVYTAIKQYVGKHKRILYSAISNYIFSEQEKRTNKKNKGESGEELILLLKVEELAAYAYKGKDLEMQGICAKIYDHANLAIRQYDVLKQSSEEYEKQFKKNVEPFKNELMHEMNGQLISLVGIFTALAFMIFGAIGSLDNVFTQGTDISVLKLIILGCVWGLGIINLVYIFLFCVGKMTGFSFKSTEKPDAPLVEKYPIIWFSNLLLIMLLACAGILYYIDKFNIGYWFVKWTENYSFVFVPVAFGVLGIAFIVCLVLIFKKRK